jgi:hypothetical protein
VKLGTVVTDHVSSVAPTANFSHSWGRFFINTFVIINFPERYALFKVDGKTRQLFDVAEDDSAAISCYLASGYTERDVYRVSILPLETSGSSPIDFTTGEEHRVVIGEASVVPRRKIRISISSVRLSTNEREMIAG